MKYWMWILFPTYVIGGLALGLADPLFGRWVQQLGFRPGFATAGSVNILLPLLAISLGVVHRRISSAIYGAAGITLGFLFGLANEYPPPRPWDIALFLHSIPPVLLVACVGYAVLGTLTALVARALWR
jgi:uncharacterized membrane protein required for colicin V production